MVSFMFEASTGQNYVVALHGKASPSAGEWSGFVALVRDFYRRSPKGLLYGITFTRGGGPDAKQRRELVDAVPKDQMTTGMIVSDSAVIRGIITAFSWLSRGGMRSFSPADYRNGFAYVHLQGPDIDRFLIDASARAEAIDGGIPSHS